MKQTKKAKVVGKVEKKATVKELTTKAMKLGKTTISHKENIKEFMNLWAEKSECGEMISSDTSICFGRNLFYLFAGEKEIKSSFGENDVSTAGHFSDYLTASKLRIFTERLPLMIDEISGKIEKKITVSNKRLKELKKIVKASK